MYHVMTVQNKTWMTYYRSKRETGPITRIRLLFYMFKAVKSLVQTHAIRLTDKDQQQNKSIWRRNDS